MSKCARCDFRADDLSEHAAESGHPLCIVCERRSLTVFERQTCAGCVASVRADLADIATAYSLLEPSGIIGLTLMGDGTMQRRMHRYELEEGIRDEWPADPLPVLPALASWEDYLRENYGDSKGAVPANLTATVDYLTSNLDSGRDLAQTFPGFDDLAAEIRQHRSRAHHAAGLADDPVAAPAECFDCGGPLLRTFAPPLEPTAVRRKRARNAIDRLIGPVRQQRDAEASYGIRDLTPWPSEAMRTLWQTQAAGRKGEGLTDEWTCAWCRLVYDQPGYFLALRAKASSWVPIPLAAETTQRSVWTVRSWARRGLVTAACRVLDRAVLVWWPDVSDRAFRHAEDADQRSA